MSVVGIFGFSIMNINKNQLTLAGAGIVAVDGTVELSLSLTVQDGKIAYIQISSTSIDETKIIIV